MLLLVPAMVVAMPLAGQDKALDIAMVVELEGETVNMLEKVLISFDIKSYMFKSYIPRL